MLLVRLFRIYNIGRQLISKSMRAPTSFASKEMAKWTVEGQTQVPWSRPGRWRYGKDSRGDGTGRNPDRGREALSPRGILYAWTWPKMARETHPGAWFEPAMSARFGASPSPSGVPCLRPMPRNDCAGDPPCTPASGGVLPWSGHDRKLPVRPTLNDRLTSRLIQPCQLPDEAARMFLGNPRQDSIDLRSALAAQFNQRQADPMARRY